MRMQSFDASVVFRLEEEEPPEDVILVVQGKRYPARMTHYPMRERPQDGGFFVRLSAQLPSALKWGDPFELMSRSRENLGRGVVLDPDSPEPKKSQLAKRPAYLKELARGERDMILALCRRSGLKGLKEDEILDFCRLSRARLEQISQGLEAEGRIKILFFSPLFLLAQESLPLLCEKIKNYFSVYHQKHPDERGLSLDRIQKHFGLSPKVISLAVRYLSRRGEIKELGGLFSLSGFEIKLGSREKELLEKMEEMSFKGELQFVSLEEIRRQFKLRTAEAQKLLDLLVERKKVVQGKDGFILHSGWLEELIRRIRALGRRELTVAEFKEMTGLTRKYAIPVLELLDELGVTRRHGPTREIL